MPLLPISYYSNYYVIQMDFQGYFSRLNIPYTPTASPVKFIASKFNASVTNDASAKTMIQGKPGLAVQDIKPLIYTYTFEAPIIIGPTTQYAGGFLPYNSLNFFALQLANWQWQQLFYGLNISNAYVYLDSYSIKASEDGINQTVTIKSNAPLFRANTEFSIDAYLISELIANGTATDVAAYIGRTAKNYDIFTDMELQQINSDGTFGENFFLNSANSGIFLESTNFDIKFEVDAKYFVNRGNTVDFMMKNYSFAQSFDIKGNEIQTDVAQFQPGFYAYYYTETTLMLASQVLLKYQAPLNVKTKGKELSSGQLTSTKLEFSMDGTTFGPFNSNYGSTLFFSNIS